jgi:hypothetical protein
VLDSVQPTSTFTTPIQVSTGGTHTLVYWAMDNAGSPGNKEAAHSITFRVSAAGPTTAISGIPAGWATSPVTFALSATGDAGPFATRYSLNGSAETTYTAPVVVSGQGVTTVSYHSVDSLARGEAAQVATIQIDSVAPASSSDVLASYVGTATVHLLPADGGSGVAHTFYRLDGGAQTEGTVVSATGASAHALEFWSVDGAGNEETPHRSASFSITAAVPTATTITIRSTATSTFIGRTPILSGTITPVDTVGRIVVVWVQKPGSARWSYSSTASPTSSPGDQRGSTSTSSSVA